jgi:intracellular multiplication protein IcmT
MAHWRNTYRPARFFFLDIRAGVIILASLIHIRLWTITLDVIVVILAWYIERIGLGFDGALRAVRAWFAGEVRPALPAHKIRRIVDFQRQLMPWDKPRETGDLKLEKVKPDSHAGL